MTAELRLLILLGQIGTDRLNFTSCSGGQSPLHDPLHRQQ